MATKADLEKELAGFDRMLAAPTTSESLKKSLTTAKAGVEKKLAELEAKDKEKKPAEKKEAKPKKEKATAKPKSEKKAEPKEEKKPEKEEKVKESRLVTIKVRKSKNPESPEYNEWKDKELDLNECDQAYEAEEARTDRRAFINKKSKSRSPAAKAADGVEESIGQITNLIPDKEIAEHPEKVIGVMNAIKKGIISEFDKLKKVHVPDGSIEKLKKAVGAAFDEFNKEVKDEMEKEAKAAAKAKK